MPRSNTVSIAAALLVVVALATVGLLRHGMGEPVADSQVSSSTTAAYYRADLEALYLHEVRTGADATLLAAGDAELLARGRSICAALDSGSAVPEGATFEVGAAATALCPQHAGVVSS